jgi:uncharacterized YigZ family protein
MVALYAYFFKEAKTLEYITLTKRVFTELTEKRSKFLAFCTPVDSEEEAISFINSIKEKHRTATHNVYAYSLKENSIARYSDDGEPQGTAGLPILDVIKKEHLQNVCIVVTRYFGGTLLGTGGLVRAYSQAAKDGIVLAGKTLMQLCDVLKIECEYTLYNIIQTELLTADAKILETDFKESVVILAATEANITNSLINSICDKTSAKAKVTHIGQKLEAKELI